MANLAADSILGNNTGSGATPIALTASQVKTLLAIAVADVTGAAPLASPALTGNPTAATQSPGNNSTRVATTAYVDAAVSAVAGGLNFLGTWNANTDSPAITNTGSAQGDFYKVGTAGTTTIDGISVWNVGDLLIYDGSAWLKIDGITSEVVSVAGRTGAVTLAVADISGAAPLASPALTGTPTAPTQTADDSSTNIATTAYVDAACSLVSGSGGPPTGSAGGDLTGSYPNPTVGSAKITLAKMANLTANSLIGNNTGSGATPVALSISDTKTLLAIAVADVSGAAPLASPALTGSPTAPTQTAADDSTKIATTAYVDTAIGVGAAPIGTAGGDLTGSYPNPTVGSAKITLAKMANLTADTIIGNNTGSGATPIALTASQVKTLLAIAAGDVSGLATSATTDTTSATNITSGTLAAGRLAAIRFHIKTFLPGLQTSANQLILRDHTAIATTIPTSGNKASGSTASTGTAVFTIYKNGSSVGTVTFTASATGVYSIGSPVSLAIDDILTIVGPASADATLADTAFTLAATA
jgi:hypothetical protein